MARSWALVPRPGAAAAARRHPATCRLLQPTPDPNTLEVRCGLARCLAGGQGRYVPRHPGAGGVRFACVVVAWPGSPGCLVRIPSFVSTASSYPHPRPSPQSVGKGSLPELRSHLLPSPPLVFLLPPTDPGSRFNLPLFPSFLAVSRARRTQHSPASPGLCPVQLCPLHTGSHSPSPFQ